jgi:hypothetical protein
MASLIDAKRALEAGWINGCGRAKCVVPDGGEETACNNS